MFDESFGHIKNQECKVWAQSIDSYIDHGQKTVRLKEKTFEWARKQLKQPEGVKEISYRGAKIIKVD